MALLKAVGHIIPNDCEEFRNRRFRQVALSMTKAIFTAFIENILA